jgi:hypothetical protein
VWVGQGRSGGGKGKAGVGERRRGLTPGACEGAQKDCCLGLEGRRWVISGSI